MNDKTKNIVIIVLSVLLFISIMFNVINFRPMMHNKMNNNMIQRDFSRSMDNMPNDRNNQRQNNNQMPENNQNNEDKQNESNQNVE
ncbi:MAG: hypothetical protein IJ105_04985 [Bacilli bacterium]|nr:hypothetical protein [Bacilli bacterium]